MAVDGDDTPSLARRVEALRREAEHRGWEEALFGYFQERIARGEPPFEDDRIADWRFLLPSHPRTVAVVLGVGDGTVPLALAPTYGTVLALDDDPARLDLLTLRAAHAGLENIEPVSVGPSGLPDVPAAGLVAVMGDDWIGWVDGFSELTAWLDRSLLESGVSYLAVGNRSGIHRLLGRGGSRRPAHGLSRYRRILRRAQLIDEAVVLPLPYHDRTPLFLLPPQQEALRHFFTSVLPLFETLSPEMKKTNRREYVLARALRAVGPLLGRLRLLEVLTPGFGLVVVRSSASHAA